MQDKNKFDPEKIAFIEFKLIKSQVNTPEKFDLDKIIGHQMGNSLQVGFNIDDKLAKSDFKIRIKTDSNGQNEFEASGDFHFIFIFKIDNLEELAIHDKNKKLDLNPDLSKTLSALSYSTSRGILLTILKGTALQNFILPVVNTNKLIHNK